MSKRKTIGKDPFATMTNGIETVEDFPLGIIAVPEIEPVRSPEVETSGPRRADTIRVPNKRARRAVGGRLEILGGDLGSGNSIVWRFGPAGLIGFIAPSGMLIDLAAQLDAVSALPDRTDHRILSAAGWAWVLGSVAGIVGVVAGGGIRLLAPRRMIISLRLRDGRKLVARTDHVTVSGLEAIAEARAIDIAVSPM